MQEIKKELLDEILNERYLLINQCYFTNMKEAFEELLFALTSNDSGNVPRAIQNLEYLRRGFDLKYAKESSERNKRHLLLSDEQIIQAAEPSEIPFRNGDN